MSAAPTDHLRPDLNGLRVKRPEHPAIYLMDGGFKRLIPNPDTYNGLFVDWNGIVTDVPLEDIPDGPMLSNGAVLVRPANSENVYLIDRATKRLIPRPELMERYHFNPKKVHVVPPIVADLIPNGKPLPAPSGGG